MSIASRVRISDVVRQRFVGRSAALNTFYLRFAYRHMKNGVYYHGEGGLGKTWILKKILLDGEEDPTRVVTDVIDFFETQNHTVRGLQTTIRSRLSRPKAFLPYDEAIQDLENARLKEDMHPGAIASLESRADKMFIECCRRAIIGEEVILLFDTFERAQERRVGQWLIEEFLPQVRSLIVAIAGRPDPNPAQMPDNIVTHKLEGLSLSETREYVRLSRPDRMISEEDIQNIWKHSNGAPLFIDLVLDLPTLKYEPFMDELSELKDDSRIQGSPRLERQLVARFARSTGINPIIWVMACFKRRFDIQMLKYVHSIEGDNPIPPLSLSYNQLLEQFKRPTYARYIKEYPEHQSHLLHDEVQRLIAEYILPEKGMEEPLRDLMISDYYPDAIATPEAFGYPETSLPDIVYQLRAEQLGYILDKHVGVGLSRYENHRRAIEMTHNYDFEELLWGEVRDHLDESENSFRICLDRGEWLRKHSLFRKAERHYRQMLTLFDQQIVDVKQFLGFMLLRQGKIADAEQVFRENRSLVRDNDFENIARIENTLGQAAQRAGKWEEALVHYTESFSAAVRIRDPHMASACLNRGELYALQGAYKQAKEQCEQAIELLSAFPENRWNMRRKIYAHRNLGAAYRYSGDHPQALHYYEIGLRIAEGSEDLQAICNITQHIGINEYLWGRALRRGLSQTHSQNQEASQEVLDRACKHQLSAWQNLTDSLEMARRADWRDMIDDGLHRLGKVYREIHRIQDLLSQLDGTIYPPNALEALQRKSAAYKVPLEVEYEQRLLTRKRFEELDPMEKAIRLFDLGALVADDVNDIHRALDSMTELARTFVELGLKSQVRIVLRRIERLKGYDYQEELFAAMNEITQGDLDFIEQRFSLALEKYARAYADVAGQSGYASFLLTDRLRDLEWRLRELPAETALRWCDVLQSEWQGRLPTEKWADMLGTLERIRTEIWTQELAAKTGDQRPRRTDYE